MKVCWFPAAQLDHPRVPHVQADELRVPDSGHEIILARETIEIAVSQYVLSLDNIAIVFIVDVIVDLEGWGEV